MARRAHTETDTAQDTAKPSLPPRSNVLGAHSLWRYRRVRGLVEALDAADERLDHALVGLLLSAESVRDELRAFEAEASALRRLAQTGHYVWQLQRLNGVVDAVCAAYGMEESEGSSAWEEALLEERAERMARYEALLGEARREVALGRESPVLSTPLLSEVRREEQQEEVLTLLLHALDKYRDDVLTPRETLVMTEAFQLVAQASNVVVVTLPAWFAAPFEFGAAVGLSRGGSDLLELGPADATRLIRAANTWSRLHHPHVAKFLGACHVGGRLFIAHEKLRPLRGYVAAVAEKNRSGADRAEVWRRLYEVGLGLQYLHERGLACERLDVDSVMCAQFEAKSVLLGVGLTEIGLSHDDADSAADVQALGRLMMDLMSEFASPSALYSPYRTHEHEEHTDVQSTWEPEDRVTSIPATRPRFVTEDEWVALRHLRDVRARSPSALLQVLSSVREIAGSKRDQFDDATSVVQAFDAPGGVFDIGQLTVPSLHNMAICAVLAQLEDLSKSDRLGSEVAARMLEIYTQLQRLNTQARPPVARLKATMAGFVVVLARCHRLVKSKAQRDAAMSSALSFFDSVGLSAPSMSSMRPQDPAVVFTLHTDIDRLLKQHGLDDSGAVHRWKKNWGSLFTDRGSFSPEGLLRLSAARGSLGLSSTNTEAHEEAEALLAFEMGQHLVGYRLSGPSSELARSMHAKLPAWFLPRSEVDFKVDGEEIGRGSFGVVVLGNWLDTRVVVKRVFINANNRPVVHAQFRREADVWFQLNHVNIVKLYGACHVGDPFFVCEYASGGDLATYLRREGRSTYRMWFSLLQAGLGLQYLHDSGVVHGDLKANNILVGADKVVKLTDFGLSISKREGIDAGTGGALGAYRWKAPECLVGEPVTLASDVYSFAMVMVEIVTGKVPWGDLDDVVVKVLVKRGDELLRPPELEDAEWRLIQRMSSRNPSDRVTIDAVVVHLSALVEKLVVTELLSATPPQDTTTLAPPRNRLGTRGGAVRSLLTLAKSANRRLAQLAGEHLRAVRICRGAQADVREIEGIVHILSVGSDSEKEWAVTALAALTWRNPANGLRVVATGVIPRLVAMLRSGTEAVQLRAAELLQNLVRDNLDSQVSIAAAGAIDPLVGLLRDGTDAQKLQAARTLWMLALSAENRPSIVAAGALGPLGSLRRDGTEELQEISAAVLSALSTDTKDRGSAAASDGGILPSETNKRSRRRRSALPPPSTRQARRDLKQESLAKR